MALYSVLTSARQRRFCDCKITHYSGTGFYCMGEGIMKIIKIILNIPLLIIGIIAEIWVMWEMEKEI